MKLVTDHNQTETLRNQVSELKMKTDGSTITTLGPHVSNDKKSGKKIIKYGLIILLIIRTAVIKNQNGLCSIKETFILYFCIIKIVFPIILQKNKSETVFTSVFRSPFTI